MADSLSQGTWLLLKLIKRLRKKYPLFTPKFEDEIRAQIQKLQTLLAPLDPLAFLKHAFGEFFVSHLGIED